MRFIILSIFLLTVSFITKGQIIVMHDIVDPVNNNESFGPNLRHFNHLYLDFGIIIGKAEGQTEIINSSSNSLRFGNRYKLKISSIYSIGLDVSISRKSFRIKQNNNKIFPEPTLHKSEKVLIYDLGFGFFNRINFRSRGNYIGEYFDFGIYAHPILQSSHITKDDYNPQITGFKKNIVNEKGLEYINDYYYSVILRFGINRYIISAEYRLSDIISSEYQTHLPVFSIGIQIGIHK
ncbi:hypothetical protein ACFLTI_10180 [Bacteroidota bacterium]